MNDTGQEIAITVNGRPHRTKAGLSLAELLAALGVAASGVAVELDGSVVTSQDFSRVRLSAGQRVEIVRLVGGG